MKLLQKKQSPARICVNYLYTAMTWGFISLLAALATGSSWRLMVLGMLCGGSYLTGKYARQKEIDYKMKGWLF